MILLIDNYDSFTYNLYQNLVQFVNEIKVVRNDQIMIEEIDQLNLSGIVLSPGPGRPEDAGICVDIIRHFSGRIPILGICLGHQAIGLAYGAQIVQSDEIVHGKQSLIFHRRSGLFKKAALPFLAGRYHSLVIEKTTVPPELVVEAESEQGLIMAVKHKKFPTYGIQFHPESILTPEGPLLIQQFVDECCVEGSRLAC